MPSFTALVRPPGTLFPQAISNHPEKTKIDLPRALSQHQKYVEALKQLGGDILSLPSEDSLPDSTFVEDTAFVLGVTAYLCSAKEESRRDEVDSVARVLKKHRQTFQLKPYIDGGDILNTPDTLYVGVSERTNEEAIQYFSKQIDKEVVPVPVLKGLHLKSAVSYLGKNILLIDPERVNTGPFKTFEWIEVEEKESYAANCLAIGNQIIMPAGFRAVGEKIREHGFDTVEVDMREFEKADGGITCLSIILPE
ncbi:MAG: arginine deiminase family protein [Nitrospinota bacterium]